ncbi:MAG: GIY-YIG nuclease family protein [Anaerolineae bacterium]|nr:GIY-YIG nuclease family protein [Anaerolineae bacterium]
MYIRQPTDKGTYLLIVRLDRQTRIQAGKLGTFDLDAGRYAYIGSAMGPGGLAARLSRHKRQDKRLHWHIDYLLQQGTLAYVLYVESPIRLECAWACAIDRLPGAYRPIPRFGSSDCACPSHLIGLSPTLADQAIQAALVETLPLQSSQVHKLNFDVPFNQC